MNELSHEEKNVARMALANRSQGEIARMVGKTPKEVAGILRRKHVAAFLAEGTAAFGREDQAPNSEHLTDLPVPAEMDTEAWKVLFEEFSIESITELRRRVRDGTLSDAQLVKTTEIALARSEKAPQPAKPEQGEQRVVVMINAESLQIAQETQAMLEGHQE